MDEEIVEINGKKYRLNESSRYDKKDGPYYEEMELKSGTKHYSAWWDAKDDAPVLCGKCKGDIFKVSSCSRDYESWAYCPCGNKFVVHSG